MEKADYSRTTPEEREKVVAILLRHAEASAAMRGADAAEELRGRAETLAAMIRAGEIVSGRAYRDLLSFLEKKAPA